MVKKKKKMPSPNHWTTREFVNTFFYDSPPMHFFNLFF